MQLKIYLQPSGKANGFAQQLRILTEFGFRFDVLASNAYISSAATVSFNKHEIKKKKKKNSSSIIL
jgi:hypothetical protein